MNKDIENLTLGERALKVREEFIKKEKLKCKDFKDKPKSERSYFDKQTILMRDYILIKLAIIIIFGFSSFMLIGGINWMYPMIPKVFGPWAFLWCYSAISIVYYKLTDWLFWNPWKLFI